MGAGGLGEEGFEAVLAFDLVAQAGLVVAGQSADDLVDFGLDAVLTLGFLDVQGVELGEGHGEDATVGHRG